jgi:hypothetical protein
MTGEAMETLLSKREDLESRGKLGYAGTFHLEIVIRMSPILRPLQSDPRWQELQRDPA